MEMLGTLAEDGRRLKKKLQDSSSSSLPARRKSRPTSALVCAGHPCMGHIEVDAFTREVSECGNQILSRSLS